MFNIFDALIRFEVDARVFIGVLSASLCQYAVSTPATAVPCSLADVTQIGGTSDSLGTPDGQLTVDDVMVFVNAYSESVDCPGEPPCGIADLTGIGGPPSPPDGELTIDDMMAFVNAFSDGCPPIIVDETPFVGIFIHEINGSFAEPEGCLVLRLGRSQLLIIDRQSGATKSVPVGALGGGLAVDTSSIPTPNWASAIAGETLALEIVGSNGHYFQFGYLITIEGDVTQLPNGEPIELFIPVKAFASAAEAAVAASAGDLVSTPTDVINHDCNNQPPRPVGAPPLPPNYHYDASISQPICTTNLPCVDQCECQFRRSIWAAQVTLRNGWASCTATGASRMALCLLPGSAGMLLGPWTSVSAYLACISIAGVAEEQCKIDAQNAYHIAYQTALSTRDGCILGCEGNPQP